LPHRPTNSAAYGPRNGNAAEILILRHQLAILQRHRARRPSLNWADRALLATLSDAIPKAARAARDCGCWSPRIRS
jgi:hypothetical protein